MKFTGTVRRFGAPTKPAAPAKKTSAVEAANRTLDQIVPPEPETDVARRDAEERQRFVDATDSEHWFAVDFETREQKEALLRALELLDVGDKYLSGLDVASTLAVLLEAPEEDRREIAEALREVATLRRPKFSEVRVNGRFARMAK